MNIPMLDSIIAGGLKVPFSADVPLLIRGTDELSAPRAQEVALKFRIKKKISRPNCTALLP